MYKRIFENQVDLLLEYIRVHPTDLESEEVIRARIGQNTVNEYYGVFHEEELLGWTLVQNWWGPGLRRVAYTQNSFYGLSLVQVTGLVQWMLPIKQEQKFPTFYLLAEPSIPIEANPLLRIYPGYDLSVVETVPEGEIPTDPLLAKFVLKGPAPRPLLIVRGDLRV